MRAEITIVIPTRNRAAMLEGALSALAAQERVPALEVIVVDNGSSDNTPEVLARAARHLPLVALSEPRAGKSHALNRALAAANGELVLFTDDDVRPSSGWAGELYDACREYQTADVFCGPIVPEFPEGTPAWMRTHPVAAPAFAAFAPEQPRGLLPAPMLPFGPNFAVTRRGLTGASFRLDLGPSERGNLMCEDTQFLEDLRRRSLVFVYVPAASVRHCIRRELTSEGTLFERAFNLGRSEVIRGRLPGMRGVEPLPSPEAVQGAFELGCLVSFVCGQLFELRALGEHERGRMSSEWIDATAWRGAPGSIARSAEELLRRTDDLKWLLRRGHQLAAAPTACRIP